MVAQVLPWLLNGGTVVATVIAQWTPLVGQRRHNGGTRKAEESLKLIHNVRIFYWATNGRPLCFHSAITAMCVPSSCLLWATCERPTSSATFVRLFWTCSKLHGDHGDHGVHGDVWTSCVPPLNDQGNRSASLLPSTATWPVLWSHKGGTKVAAPVERGYNRRACYITFHRQSIHGSACVVEMTLWIHPGLGWLNAFSLFPPQRLFPLKSKLFYLNLTYFWQRIGVRKCTGWPFHDLDPRSRLWHRLAKICLSAR